jgi:hypothetical protein
MMISVTGSQGSSGAGRAARQAEARIAGALTAGGHLVSGAQAPMWWGLADPEDNEACVATWVGREQIVTASS